MKDLKIKPGMDTPKAKLKNPAPKDADSLLKQHMDKRQREKEPESRDPVRYATDRVEKNMRRGAAGAADASRRMIKHYRGKLRQGSQKLRRLLIHWPHLPHDFMLILLIETITEEVCNTFFDNFTKILRGHLRAGAPSFEWTILLLTVHMQLFELVSMPF